MNRRLSRYEQPKSTQTVITSAGLILEKTRGLRDHIWDHHTCEAKVGEDRTGRVRQHRSKGLKVKHRDLQGSTETYRDPQGPKGAYRDVYESTGTLRGLQWPTGTYRDLQGPTKTQRPTGTPKDLRGLRVRGMCSGDTRSLCTGVRTTRGSSEASLF